MENKVIQHIADKKILYFILIALMGATGVVMSFDFSGSEGGALKGNVEELVTEAQSNVVITYPAQATKMSEGTTFKVTWEDPGAQKGASYSLSLNDPQTDAVVLDIADSVTDLGVSVDFPYTLVSAEEKMKNFTLKVSVDGTDLSSKVNVDVVDTPRLTVLAPEEGMKFEVGEQIKFSWKDPVKAATYNYGVALVNTEDSSDRLVVAEQSKTNSATFTVPQSALNGLEMQTYRVELSLNEENLLVQGPVISLVDAGSATQELDTVSLVETQVEEIPQVANTETQQLPSATQEAVSEGVDQTPSLPQTTPPTVVTESKPSTPSVATVGESSFNKLPNPKVDPLKEVPGFLQN